MKNARKLAGTLTHGLRHFVPNFSSSVIALYAGVICLWRMMFNSTDDYLSKLAEKNVLADEIGAVLAALKEDGKWEQCIEWRISTYTETTISYEMFNDEKRFRVHVKCDHEFSCLSPTVERSLEMAGLYQQLIFKLFHQVGWASWESIDVLRSE